METGKIKEKDSERKGKREENIENGKAKKQTD